MKIENRFPNVLVYNSSLTEIQENVTIGDGSRIGSFTLIHENAVIGSDCTVGSHCNICACSIGDNVIIQTACHITKGVVIEDDVFIGPGVVTLNDKLLDKGLKFPHICKGAKIGGGSVILPGVRIGEYAVLGAGSIVTKDVLPKMTVLGNPARFKLMNPK